MEVYNSETKGVQPLDKKK